MYVMSFKCKKYILVFIWNCTKVYTVDLSDHETMFCIFIDNAESGNANGVLFFVEFDKSTKNLDFVNEAVILGNNPPFLK